MRAELANLVDDFSPLINELWPRLEDHKYRWELHSYGSSPAISFASSAASLTQRRHNSALTHVSTSGRPRTYTDVFSWLCHQLPLIVPADARQQTHMDGVWLPCKRAVVSSILTGGSTKAQFTGHVAIPTAIKIAFLL